MLCYPRRRIASVVVALVSFVMVLSASAWGADWASSTNWQSLKMNGTDSLELFGNWEEAEAHNLQRLKITAEEWR